MNATVSVAGKAEPILIGACLLSLALTLLVSPAGAQSATHFRVVAGGGAAVPTGSNPDKLRTGFQLQAGVESSAIGPLAVRLEAEFNHLGFTYIPALPCAFPGCSPTDGRERNLSVTVNGIYHPSSAKFEELEPYLIAGAGVYNHDNSAYSRLSGTDVGLNAGAGIGVPHLHLLLEARAHLVRNAPNFIPFTAAIRF